MKIGIFGQIKSVSKIPAWTDCLDMVLGSVEMKILLIISCFLNLFKKTSSPMLQIYRVHEVSNISTFF